MLCFRLECVICHNNGCVLIGVNLRCTWRQNFFYFLQSLSVRQADKFHPNVTYCRSSSEYHKIWVSNYDVIYLACLFCFISFDSSNNYCANSIFNHYIAIWVGHISTRSFWHDSVVKSMWQLINDVWVTAYSGLVFVKSSGLCFCSLIGWTIVLKIHFCLKIS